ncbi:paraquat-inducible protein A [Shewanella mangrovi]|uniref:Paraquat-inducible protein A n=1 Tax=Shewanella mangrovi TaxID=1515746 RepID=A0A094JKL8_9GAMM|nr:paraquat-inducible protein A [Shewanella mangrovi]
MSSTKPRKHCNLIVCRGCDLVVSKRALPSGVRAVCPQCHTPLYDRPYCAMNGVLALCITSILLYIPSMLFPVLEIHFLGSIRSSTVFQGAMAVWHQGYWVVGLGVLLGAVIAPAVLLGSIMAQMIIIQTGWYRTKFGRDTLNGLLRYHSFINQMSMLEIYVISFLVTSFQLSDFADVYFGLGTLCFTLLFVVTLFLQREYNLEHMWGYVSESDD